MKEEGSKWLVNKWKDTGKLEYVKENQKDIYLHDHWAGEKTFTLIVMEYVEEH